METYTLKLVVGDERRELRFVGPAGARAAAREASDWATDYALDGADLNETLALTVHAMTSRGFRVAA